MTAHLIGAFLIVGSAAFGASAEQPMEARLPCDASGSVDAAELVERLARATQTPLPRPPGSLLLPIIGVGGKLSLTALQDILGPAAVFSIDARILIVTVDSRVALPDRSAEWRGRLQKLAELIEREERRRATYGMHALASYRPNDPTRPTICLVHGLNSSSGGFAHMIRPLEAAGFGVVVFDYAYNRDLNESCVRFQRDWATFHRAWREKRPWAIVAHSMGALLARSYVENPAGYANDVSSLVMIAPVNQGSNLAKAQTLLQLLQGVRAVQEKNNTEALAHLGDGLGQAAEDISPGSAFLSAINRQPRRPGVAYHILAGDKGFVTRETRLQVEEQLESLRRKNGFLGELTRLATTDMKARLDEVSEGTGDGCVSVANTRLAGVDEPVVVHANHAELIRAPLLFDDEGPVVCMPYLIRWLGSPAAPAQKARVR